MATVDVTFANDWTKIVEAGEEFLLTVPSYFSDKVAVAVAAAPPAATVTGHVLDPVRSQEMNRALIGPGIVYARKLTGAAVSGALTVWVP